MRFANASRWIRGPQCLLRNLSVSGYSKPLVGVLNRDFLQRTCFRERLIGLPVSQVRHGGALIRIQKEQVKKTFEEQRHLGDVEDLDALSVMPNFKKWYSILQKVCGSQPQDRFVAAEEWLLELNDTKESDPRHKQSFFGAMMLLAKSFRYDQMGDSIIAFHQSRKLPINTAVAGHYLRLCGRSEAPNFEERVMQAYKYVKRSVPSEIYDASTAECIISSLYRTDKWQECSKLVDMLALSGRPGVSALSFTAAGSFLHNNPEEGITMMQRLKRQQMTPNPIALRAWFDYAKQKGRDAVMDLLNFTKDAEWYLPLEAVKDLRTWMESEQDVKWIGKLTTVTLKGECKACQEYMEPITIKKEEFDKLRENFIQLVIKKNDIFESTNPAELQTYTEFITKHAPFDVVVDGLNASYFQNNHTAKPKELSRQLRFVTEHLLHRQSKKILILGRKHMLNWASEDMSRIYSMANCFFAENVSQDDPFLLYAALFSGLGCVILSGDLMRDHRFKLAVSDQELRKTFLKWQRTHQMELLKVHRDGTVKIKAPMKFNTVTQWTPTSMHVPYDSGIPRSLHELPTTWLCLTVDKRDKRRSVPKDKPLGSNHSFSVSQGEL